MTVKDNKPAGDTVPYEFDFSRLLETRWRPGYQYDATAYVRPITPNGFEYECTTGGQSAHDEPEWPTTVAATVTDGSVTWTARAFAKNASDTIQTQQINAPAALTVANILVDDDTRLDFTVAGGVAGSVYDISIEITTVAGEIYTETLRLTVTE